MPLLWQGLLDAKTVFVDLGASWLRRIPSLVLGSSSFCEPDWTAGRLDGRLLRLVCYPFGVFLSCWLSSAFFAFLVTRFSGVSSRKRVSGGALRRPDRRAITEPIHLRRRKHGRLHATCGHGWCAASHAEAFRRFRPPARPYSHPPTLLCLPSYKGVRPAGARVHAVEANSATFVRLGVNVRPPPTPRLRLFTPCGRVLAPAQCSRPPTGTCSSRA